MEILFYIYFVSSFEYLFGYCLEFQFKGIKQFYGVIVYG